MSDSVNPHEALIYTMVTMSAVDRQMSDTELSRIGNIATTLPAFAEFDEENIVQIAQACGEILGRENGLNDVLDTIANSLPQKLYETAYAVAVEIAAVDLDVKQEELRFLSMLRDRLRLDKLVVSAIERGARARHAVV
ncbi:MAG: tellurite resistance TerB family protein [Methyloligellaceae bacterium]